MLESANRRQEAKLKEQLSLTSFLAGQIQERIGSMFDKSAKVTQLWDAFPELFEKEKEIIDKKEQEKQLKMYLAKFQHFALNHNTKMN